MKPITDTHAHLYYPELTSDIENILSRAKDSGIDKIIAPAVNYDTVIEILKLSEKHEMIYCAAGIHPCDVNKSETADIDKIEKLLDNEKIVAIGETGLDYYWDTSGMERQKDFFRLQIELAKSKALPVIIHTRNSLDDAIIMVYENFDDNLKGQFHCFSGNTDQLSRVLELNNFYVSFCGNATYKTFKETETVKECPLERMLSETDSPFLPPVPHRGKTNEPSFIINTLKKISGIKETEPDLLLEKLHDNSERLFFKKGVKKE